jgi:hypothetical protein
MAAPVFVEATSGGLTIATTAYSINDVVGNEFSWTSAVSGTGLAGMIVSAQLLDQGDVLGACDLYLFRATTGISANNAAFAPSDANNLLRVGIIQFPAPIDQGANRAADWMGTQTIKCNATTLFGILVTKTANAVFTAVTDVVISLGIWQG